MLVPHMYEAPSAAQVDAVITGHPMAVLVTNGPDVPHATHLPVIRTVDTEQTGPGSVLLGHMNRTNPHWSALTSGTPGKLIFTGPNTYVCPVLYQTEPAAPTWDFVVVHVSGRVMPLDAGEPTLAVVQRTAATLEGAFGAGWDHTGSIDYFRSIVGGVGAFEFVVEQVESMFKLSQEKDHTVRQRLIDDFTSAPRNGSTQVGQLMSDLNLGVAP